MNKNKPAGDNYMRKYIRGEERISPGNVLIGIGILAIGTWWIKKVIADIRKNRSEKRLDTPAAQIASEIYSATRWSLSEGFTNEPAMFAAAQKIKLMGLDLKDVVREYKALYGRSLEADLNSELTSDHLRQIYSIVNLTTQDGSVPTAAKVQAKAGDWAISISAVNVRKTPKLIGGNGSYTHAVKGFLELPKLIIQATKAKSSTTNNSNIIGTPPANCLLGVFTGKTSMDAQSNVLFYELRGYEVDLQKGIVATYIVWVAGSQIKTISPPYQVSQSNLLKIAKWVEAKGYSYLSITRSSYDNTLSGFSEGPCAAYVQQAKKHGQIYSKYHDTVITASGEKITTTVKKDVILGIPTAKDKNGLIEFVSPSGDAWKVHSNNIYYER